MIKDNLVIDGDSADWETEVLTSQVPVFVDFWAPWCGPCRWVAPIVEQLAKEFDGRVKFVKINVDDNPELASRYSVMAIPTLIIFKEGKIDTQFIGAASKEHYVKMLDNLLRDGR